MTDPDRRIIGCNVIDPLLEVKGGTDYTPAITERSLEFLKGLGHDAIEYSHACHWSPEECEKVRVMTDRIGLTPWSMHAWAGWDITTEDGARQSADMLAVAVRNALVLGTERVIHHPCGKKLDSPEDRSLVEREAELIAGVWKPGVRFAFENMHSRPTLEYAIALADALGEKRAGICVDTGHAALGDLGPGRAIRMAGERLITTHIQDNLGERDDHMPPWDGTIDWEDVIAALREVEYPGCVQLELTDQPADPERRAGIKEELRRGVEAARKIAEALG